MAEFIPDRLPAKATRGEERTYNLLKKLPDDYLVYYEPKIDNSHPDFIVIAPDLGVIVIEVKGWYLDDIIRASDSEVTVIFDRFERKEVHPLEQARRYQWRLVDACKNNPKYSQLLHQDGMLKNRFTFPFAHFVILSNITQNQLDNKEDGVLNAVFRGENTMTRDSLIALENASPEEIAQKLKGYFHPFWPIKTLTSEQIDVLRAVIHPEIILSYIPSETLKKEKELIQTIKVLDKRQENNARRIGEGHRIISGVAGSGKTVLLLARARILHDRDKDAKILLLCYNVSLAAYLQAVLADYPRVTVTHFDGWAKYNGIIRHYKDPDTGKTEEDDKLGERFLSHLKQREGDFRTYDGILVDEAQDFPPVWFQCILTAMKDPLDGDLLIVCDGNQGIRPIGNISWKSLGIKAQGRTLHRTMDLDRNYRNTREILEVASCYAPKECEYDEDSMGIILVDPHQAVRRGVMPYLAHCKNHEDECDKVVALIQGLFSGKLPDGKEIEELSPEDIGILYRRASNSDKALLNNLVAELSQIAPVRWLTKNRSSRRKVLEKCIKLQTVDSAKGLQYKAVIVLWTNSFIPYQQEEFMLERNRFYVALTRAEDYLFVMNSSENALSHRILHSNNVIHC